MVKDYGRSVVEPFQGYKSKLNFCDAERTKTD